MRHVFIADAHLGRPEEENYQKLLVFLDTLPGTTDTLFILGDLFEFWIGHRTMPYPHYLPVLERLRKIREQGVRIVYLEGNHDFHMGSYFSRLLQAQVFPGPTIFTLDQKKVYLCHGDEINRLDYAYRLLRVLFHSRLTKMLAYIVPPAVPSFIADRMGRKSKKSHGKKREIWDCSAIAREFAAARFASGCDVVITGHFHSPFMERLPDYPHNTLLCLGDWITQFSYAEWRDGKVELKRYNG